jgi:DNA-binding HxlR family transcriptional regulator
MLAKSYKQFCGVAKALDIVGERWTLLIVRDLLLGPRRYTDFARSLVGITPSLLAKRLRELTEHGVVEPTASRTYQLTEHGRCLEPVVLGLGAFGARTMHEPAADDRVDPRWLMISLKRRYRGSSQRGSVGMVFGEEPFRVAFEGPSIDVRDGLELPVEVTLVGSIQGWFPLISLRAGLRELESKQLLVRTGSSRTASALVKALGMRP